MDDTGPIIEHKGRKSFQQNYIPLQVPDVQTEKELEKNRLKKLRRKERKRIEEDVGLVDQPGVVYIGHIPHGFYESQMTEFFSQFGDVKKVCLARSRKTGYSKGYAFVEFEFEEVAKIVADTMNNYLMFDKILKCVFVPTENVKKSWFLKHDHEYRKEMKQISKKEVNAIRTGDEMHTLNHKRCTRLNNTEEKLKAMGIHYKYPGQVPEKVKISQLKENTLKKSFTTQATNMLKAHAKAKINQKMTESGSSGKVSKFPIILRKRLTQKRHKEALQLARLKSIAKKYGRTQRLKKRIQDKAKVKTKFTVTEKAKD